MAEDQGAIETITDWDQIPNRLLETIMEGLAKEPSKWMIMGLGFYLGWKGIDVLAFFTKTFKLGVDAVGSVLKDSTMNLATFAISSGFNLLGLLGSIAGPITGPVKATDTPAGGTYTDDDGVVHKGRGYSAPVAQTTKDMETAPPAKDGGPSEYEKWKLDFDAHMIAGAIGALTAVMITQPGFVQGIGEIVKGVGEIVPL